MLNKILVFAAIGAAVGILLAEFAPELGLNKGERFVSEIGHAFGGARPYARNASIGAAVGALIGFLSRK